MIRSGWLMKPTAVCFQDTSSLSVQWYQRMAFVALTFLQEFVSRTNILLPVLFFLPFHLKKKKNLFFLFFFSLFFCCLLFSSPFSFFFPFPFYFSFPFFFLSFIFLLFFPFLFPPPPLFLFFFFLLFSFLTYFSFFFFFFQAKQEYFADGLHCCESQSLP